MNYWERISRHRNAYCAFYNESKLSQVMRWDEFYDLTQSIGAWQVEAEFEDKALKAGVEYDKEALRIVLYAK